MVKLYVEGGGDSNALRTACRQAFSAFITNAGVANRPRVVACGGRSDAFESFRTAVVNGEEAFLLVDSEAAVAVAHQQPGDKHENWTPWLHLKQRQGDGWEKPIGSVDTDCHLMVECMENWFLADRATLASFFGQGFAANALPAVARELDSISKAEAYRSLENATRNCRSKGSYGKGEHSFKLLGAIDANKVTAASPWAKRFVEALKAKMSA